MKTARTTMYWRGGGFLVLVALAVLALGAGCASTPKKSFDATSGSSDPSASAEANAGSTKGGQTAESLPEQPMGAEGFKVDKGDMGEDNTTEITDADAAAALKTVYFDYDSPELSDATRATLAANAAWLMKHAAVRVEVQGHCDERGTVTYNLNLGEKRARSVRDYLASLGVSVGRMSTISYGKEKPAVPGTGEEVWSKNRRAEFVVTGK